jgi:hypothetical protein
VAYERCGKERLSFFFALNTNLVMFNLSEGGPPPQCPPSLSPNKILPLLSLLLLRNRENKFPCESEPTAVPKVGHTEVLQHVLHVMMHIKLVFSICPCLQAGCGHSCSKQ